MRQLLSKCSLYFLSLITLTIFTSCAGYQLGNTKHEKLKNVENIYVPMVENKTLEIKLAPQTTNEIVKAISNDSTYRVTRSANSDATLKAVIDTVKYEQFRSNRLDSLLAEELTMTVVVNWELVNNAGKTLLKGRSTGSTRYYADSNQRVSRDNAKYDSLHKVAQKITSRISNGF